MSDKTTKTGKHTEGPWEVCQTVFEVKSDKIFWQQGVKSGGVRVANAIGVGRERAEANAHLIASAPLMYSILKRIQKDGFESIGDVEIEDALIQAEGRA